MSLYLDARPLFGGFYWQPYGAIADPGLYFWGAGRGPVRLWGFGFFLQFLMVAMTLPGMWLMSGDADPADIRTGLALVLCAQPFCLIASWRVRQFGMVLIGVLWTCVWIKVVAAAF